MCTINLEKFDMNQIWQMIERSFSERERKNENEENYFFQNNIDLKKIKIKP